MNPTNEMTRAVDVGGRRLVLTTSGDGAPTVVLETGLGAESDEWSAVQRSIAPLVRVCRYDRAGRGASDPAARPRSAAALIADLHTLLQGADLPPPYLLVGHSFGGLLMRLFAHRHRALVAGLVLVDAMHEDQFGVFGPTFPPPRLDEPAGLAETREFWTRGWRDPRSTPEGLDLVASCEQARTIDSLGDLPPHVLTAGTFSTSRSCPRPCVLACKGCGTACSGGWPCCRRNRCAARSPAADTSCSARRRSRWPRRLRRWCSACGLPHER
jgi:pimeloyl-ACP methyl ester carboxylesterase